MELQCIINMKIHKIIKTSKQIKSNIFDELIFDDCLHEFILKGEKSNEFEITSKMQ